MCGTGYITMMSGAHVVLHMALLRNSQFGNMEITTDAHRRHGRHLVRQRTIGMMI